MRVGLAVTAPRLVGCGFQGRSCFRATVGYGAAAKIFDRHLCLLVFRILVLGTRRLISSIVSVKSVTVCCRVVVRAVFRCWLRVQLGVFFCPVSPVCSDSEGSCSALFCQKCQWPVPVSCVSVLNPLWQRSHVLDHQTVSPQTLAVE